MRGYPLVINKWASWCVPCQSERSAFQHGLHRARTLGRVHRDRLRRHEPGHGRAFLRALPVGYPSYYDQNGQLATASHSSFTPVTVFYDRAGHQFIWQGPFPSAARLEAAVRRYALDS